MQFGHALHNFWAAGIWNTDTDPSPYSTVTKEAPMKVRMISMTASVAFAAGMLAAPGAAQELSPAQREVWQFIEACNEHFAAGNQAAVLDCFHDDFSGWRYGDTVPRSKRSVAKFLPIDLESKIVASDLRPISIRVFGDYAIVHYFLEEAQRSANGEVERQKMIWTDILLKQNNRWRWVGDHGGPID